MKIKTLSLWICALSLSLSACSHDALSGSEQNQPFIVGSQAEGEPCLLAHSAERTFLPVTTEPSFERILPAQENECGFYNWAQQSFFFVTQPNAQQQPAFVNYRPFEDVFGLAATSSNPGGQRLTLNAGFNQAGEQGAILVDQNRNPIFFSMHINTAFADFVEAEQLNQLLRLLKDPQAGGVAAELEFPPGAIELKAAWKIVEPGEDNSRYFTLPARVPVLKNQGKQVVATGDYRDVTVAMLALHVVGVVQDHPEFIWASFEHIDEAGTVDLAPSAVSKPIAGVPSVVKATDASKYPLFNPHQPGNTYRPQPIDEASQKFAHPTSVFRVFPGSLSEQSELDEELVDMNQSVQDLFAISDPQQTDPRRYYQMIGAVWLDDPGSERPDGIFKANRLFENHSESPIMAGENRLSNMAMESFTQEVKPNCFSCHDTSKKYVGKEVMPPRRINVSNVLTFFAQRKLEQQAPGKIPD